MQNDQNGYSTTYDYNLQSGLLNSVTDALGNKTSYTYNSKNNNLTKVESGGKTVSYAYDSSYTKLTDITHNGFKYSFTYDVFGNTVATKVAGATLMTNTYGAGNGLLTKSTYGNGDYNEYVYDDLGRTTRVNKNGSNAYYWRYNANGMTAMHTDYVSDRVYYYTYDSLGRIVAETEKTQNVNEYRFANNYTYDTSNNLTQLINTADGLAVSTKYTYDTANRPSKTYLNAAVDHVYSYDALGRLSKKTINTSATDPVVVTYTYWLSKRNEGTDQTYRTTQIGWESFNGRTYGYTYDKAGNLTEIKEKPTSTGAYTVKATYVYDELGQLTRENNLDLNKTIVYNYNSGGNLTSRVEYPYTTGTLGTATDTINYTYDSTWKDKLTKYDGDSITYDAIGNPLTYRDGMSFTWQGRQMKTAKTADGTSVTYKYNADGLRTIKQVGSTVHEYEYSGDKLFYEKRGDIKFYYRYDVNGDLAAITRLKADGTKFTLYPITNSRGDVEELRKSNGDLYARYVYDSWGNTICILGADGKKIDDPVNLSVQNPFRYRGYYYDAESGLYYLQSRYYDPQTGRFVNPDAIGVVTASEKAVTDKNLYAYCDNNPVVRVDDEGAYWLTAIGIGAGVGAIAGLAGQVITDIMTSAMTGTATISNWQTYAGAVAGGAIGGAVLAATRNMNAANIATGFFTTGISLSLEKVTIKDYDKSWGEIGLNAATDGAVSYGLGKIPGINKYTKGRNNYSATYKSGLTKLWNNTSSRMSAKVVKKGVVSSLISGLGLDAYYADKTVYYQKAKMLFKRLG